MTGMRRISGQVLLAGREVRYRDSSASITHFLYVQHVHKFSPRAYRADCYLFLFLLGGYGREREQQGVSEERREHGKEIYHVFKK